MHFMSRALIITVAAIALVPPRTLAAADDPYVVHGVSAIMERWSTESDAFVAVSAPGGAPL